MNHPEEVKALMLGESQKAELVTESSIQGAKAMKSSEILRKALEKMDGGAKWVNRCGDAKTKFCALNAIGGGHDNACKFMALGAGVPFENIPTWNDHAPDFSVIQQGFEKAIALAEAEGD